MLRKMSRFVVCVSVLLLTATTVLYARRGAVAVTQNDLGTRSLENVKIEAQSIGALLEKLSLHYDIPIGVEIASKKDKRAMGIIEYSEGLNAYLLEPIHRIGVCPRPIQGPQAIARPAATAHP